MEHEEKIVVIGKQENKLKKCIIDKKKKRKNNYKPALLFSDKGVNARVSWSSSKINFVFVRNVNSRFRFAITFCQTKVDDKHFAGKFANAHQKVVGLERKEKQ